MAIWQMGCAGWPVRAFPEHATGLQRSLPAATRLGVVASVWGKVQCLRGRAGDEPSLSIAPSAFDALVQWLEANEPQALPFMAKAFRGRHGEGAVAPRRVLAH
jgi:hypothetical protein